MEKNVIMRTSPHIFMTSVHTPREDIALDLTENLQTEGYIRTLIDFNGILSRQRLFYAKSLQIHIIFYIHICLLGPYLTTEILETNMH